MSAGPPPRQAALREPADLRRLLQKPFTDEQLAAATADLGPGVIVAGAGSGKTAVMAARVVWLVGTGRVAPDRVLGLTFTTKAAGELAGRVRAALQQAGVTPPAAYDGADGPGDGPDGELGPTVSTYHAYAGRLVVEHALRLGVEPRARLLADATRFQLAARVLRRYPHPVASLTRPLSMLVGDLVALESTLSEHLVEPAALVEHDRAWLTQLAAALEVASRKPGNRTHCKTLETMAAGARQRIELAGLAVELRAAKRELDAVDFGDQVALAARLAEGWPEVARLERERFDVVLLDEYQDTSVAQRRMLAGLFGDGHPVTAVGDPCQAIYGWRGASVSNLDRFPEHFPRADGSAAPVFELSVNQRSGGRLLALANAVAEQLRRRHRVVELQPRPDQADAGRTVVALHRSWDDEVRWLAGQLREAVDAGTPPGECAVLVRARVDFGAVHAALTAAGLPVEVVGLGGLLGLPEVADVVATLEVLDDPTANAALLRLLTGPRWRLGLRDLAALGARARHLLRRDDRSTDDRGTDDRGTGDRGTDDRGTDDRGTGDRGTDDPAGDRTAGDDRDPLEEAVAGVDPCDVTALVEAVDRPGPGVSAEARRRLALLSAELRALRAHVGEPLLDLVARVVTTTGLDVELAASPEAVAARRRDSLAAFVDVVAGFTDLDGEQSLVSFLAFLRAAETHERGLDAAAPVPGSNAVQLLTAHRAKGLEWDVVAIPDLTRSVFPGDRLQDRWHRSAAVLPTPLRGDVADLPALPGCAREDLDAFDDDCRAHLEREERRLGYVAFTRARHTLIGSGHWWGPTQKKPRGPSPFLLQLKEHVEAGHGEVTVWTDAPPEASNPLLEPGDAPPWPSPYEPAALARRQAAADAVRSALAGAADGTAAGEDPSELSAEERALLDALDRDTRLLVAEARRDLDPVRLVELPRTLSASALLQLRADPDALAADLARPLPRRPAPAARRGTRFHAWVETLWSQRPLLGPDELPGAEDDGATDDADLAALQAAFLATPWAQRQPHALEAPFALSLAGRVVRGRIDAVYDLGGGRWDVVDWKTGQEAADPLQLAVYRLAWAQLRGVPVEAVGAAFLYVRSGRVSRPELPALADLVALLGGVPPRDDGEDPGGGPRQLQAF